MTITTEDIISGGLVGNGSTNNHSTPFFQRNADIRALLVTDATGAETLWVLDTDYTLTGAGNPSGGTLIATTPHPTGTTLYITVDPPQTQEAINPGAAATEDALDKLTQLVLQMGLRVDRSFKLPEADRLAGPVSTTIPAGLASDRAFDLMGFDGSGAFGVLDVFGSPTPVAASIAYSPSTHYGRHLLIDVDSENVTLTLPDAAGVKDGTGFYVRANSNTHTPAIAVAVSGQLRSRPYNGVTGHDTTANTIYLGYSPDTQASAVAYVWKDTTTGGTPAIWQIVGMIRDGVADDNQITPGGGGGGGGGGGAVDSVVGQTGDVTANQIKTAVAALSDTNFATDAQISKLAGIETGATADQTGAEIKAFYEAESDTNAFTDAEKAKLGGVESSATADQSDAEIETAYNSQVAVVGQSEAEAGTATTVRRWTAQRVAQAIAALAPEIDLSHGGFSSISSEFDPSADDGLHALVDVASNAVDVVLPDVSGVADGTRLWLRVNSVDNLASVSVAETGQMRSRNWHSSHDVDADQIFIGLSQATQEGSWVYIFKRNSVWQVSGLLRDTSSDDLTIGETSAPSDLTEIAAGDIDDAEDLDLVWDNSESELKQTPYRSKFDLLVSRPSDSFTINADSPVKTIFAPTGGSTCTIEAMRVGQVVPFRNTSGGTYSFSASGVSITGDTSVDDEKGATIEAITATAIFITAES